MKNNNNDQIGISMDPIDCLVINESTKGFASFPETESENPEYLAEMERSFLTPRTLSVADIGCGDAYSDIDPDVQEVFCEAGGCCYGHEPVREEELARVNEPWNSPAIRVPSQTGIQIITKKQLYEREQENQIIAHGEELIASLDYICREGLAVLIKRE